MPNARDDGLTIGPGTIEQTTHEKPTLEGYDENYYAEILNPLSQTFVGRVASSRPSSSPFEVRVSSATPTITRNEDDVRRNYGLDLKNADHTAQKHYSQTISIPAGGTVRLPGNEAQVIIRQLVNVIMDKRDQHILKGDSWARKQVEDEIVLKIGTMDEFFTTQRLNVKEVLNRDLNNEAEEQPFPGAVNDPGNHRKPGRPRKGTTEPNPEPGTGSHYQKTAA